MYTFTALLASSCAVEPATQALVVALPHESGENAGGFFVNRQSR